MDRSYGSQQYLNLTRSGQQAHPYAAGAAAEMEHGWGLDNAPGQLGGRLEGHSSTGSASLDAYLANSGATTAAGMHKLNHSSSFSATVPGVARTSSGSNYPGLSSSLKSAGRQPAAAHQHATYSTSSSYGGAAQQQQQQQGYLDLLDSKAGLGSGYASAYTRSRSGLTGHSSKALDSSAGADSSLHRAPPSPRTSYGSGLLGTSSGGLGGSQLLQPSGSSKLWSAGSGGPMLGRTSSSGSTSRAAAAGALGSSSTSTNSSLLHGKLHSGGQAADSLARTSRGLLSSEVTHTYSTSQRRISQEGQAEGVTSHTGLRRSSSFTAAGGNPPATSTTSGSSSSSRARNLAGSSSFGQQDLGPAGRHAGLVSHTSATAAELLAGMPGLNLLGDRVGLQGPASGSAYSTQQHLGRTSSSNTTAPAAAAVAAGGSTSYASWTVPSSRTTAIAAAKARLQAAGTPAASAAPAAAGASAASVATTRAGGHQMDLSDANFLHTLEATAQLLRRESQTSGELRGSAASTPGASFTQRHPQQQQQQRMQEAPAATEAMAPARARSSGMQEPTAAGVGMPEAPLSRTGSQASTTATHRRAGSFLGCINKPTTVGSDEDEADPVTLSSSPPRSSSRIPTPDLFKPKQQPQQQAPQQQQTPSKQAAPKAASKQPKPVAASTSVSSRSVAADSAASSRTGSARSAASSISSSRASAAAAGASPGTRPPPEAIAASLRKVSFTKAAAAAVSGGACDQGGPAAAAAADTGATGASPAAAEEVKPLVRTSSPAASLRNWFKGTKSSGSSGSSSGGASSANAAAGKPAVGAATASSGSSSSKGAAAKTAAKSITKAAASSTSSKPAAAKAAAKPGAGTGPSKAAASTTTAKAAAGSKVGGASPAQHQQQQPVQPQPLHVAVEQLQHLERSGGSFGSGASFYTARGSLPGTAPYHTSCGGVAEEEGLEEQCARAAGSAFAAAAAHGYAGHGREGSDAGLYHTANSLSPPGSPRSPGECVGPGWDRGSPSGGVEEGRPGWSAARTTSFRIGTAVEEGDVGMSDAEEGRALHHASSSMREGRRTSQDSEDTAAARHRLFTSSRCSSMADRGGSNSSSPLGPTRAGRGNAAATAAAAMRRSGSSASDVSSMSVSDGGSTRSGGSDARRRPRHAGASAAAADDASSDAGGSASDAGSCQSDDESVPAVTVARPVRAVRQVGSTLTRRSSTRPEGCVGLANLGNTCFMNSILQCLNCVPEFVAQMRKVTWHTGGTSSGCDAGDTSGSSSTPGSPAAKGASSSSSSSSAPSSPLWRMGRSQSQHQQPLALQRGVGPAYVALLRQMWEGGGAPATSAVPCVSPARLLREVAAKDDRWGEGCQQDSQEFLTSLLEMLQAECNRVRGKPLYRELSGRGTETEQADAAAAYARSWHDSMIDDLFGGQLQSTLTCNTCGWQSHCFDPCLGVSVPIPKKRPVTVEDCLAAFVEQEQLGGSEQVKCGGKCASLQPATKKLQIYQAPKVLVLTLKRFSNSGAEYGYFSPFSKNSTPVDVPEGLDLTPFCNPKAAKSRFWGGSAPKKYKLVALSHHSGSLRGGHYTAEGRAKDGGWWEFNDEYVYSQSGAPVGPSSSAYVLFYRQQ